MVTGILSMVLFTKLLTEKRYSHTPDKILSMVLFTKLLTNKFDEKWEELILSMVLFTKLLTNWIIPLNEKRF